MNFELGQKILLLTIFLIYPLSSPASQWVNPKGLVKDPNIVRLQQGKGGLAEVEKEEVKKYGLTGLELMTYLFFNQEPGNHDRDSFMDVYAISPEGKIFRTSALDKNIYLYKDKLALVKLEGIKPGEVMRR